MDENVLAALALDEAEALAALNHFTVPCSLLKLYSFLSAGLTLSTTLSYLMPQVPSPQQSRGRLQASFGKTASGPANKKMAASVTLRPL